MLTFNQYIKEINDNPSDSDVVKQYTRLANKPKLDSMEKKKFEILHDHPAVKKVRERNQQKPDLPNRDLQAEKI